MIPSSTVPPQPPSVRSWGLLLAVVAGILGGCADGPEGQDLVEGGSHDVEAPSFRPSDGLLDRPDLQSVVELQIQRECEPLLGFLANPDPAVRARAAFGLASFPCAPAVPELLTLLAEPEVEVRRDAAFALRYQEPPDGGEALLLALEREVDPGVRRLLLEALGRQGSVSTLHALLEGQEFTPEERLDTPAFAGYSLRGADTPGLVDVLVDVLRSGPPQSRHAAALSLALAQAPALSGPHMEAVREALDLAGPMDPAAMHLVMALGKGSEANDTERLLDRLRRGADWRVRVNAAVVLGAPHWLERPGVRGALLEAVGDRSVHVGVAAATSLMQGFRIPREVLEEARTLLNDDTGSWQTRVPLLGPVATLGEPDPVLRWTERLLTEHPAAARRGLETLSGIDDPRVRPLLLEAVRHPDPHVRGTAISALQQRWMLDVLAEEEVRSTMELFGEALLDDHPYPAVMAARALGATPVLLEQGGRTLLDEALSHHEGSAPPHLIRELRQAMGEPVSPPPLAEVDWGLLASLGSKPRLRLATTRGELVFRLTSEEAPLTVSALAHAVRMGAHDGVPFHRVLPNFVLQGGDTALGDGTGVPSVMLRTETTTLPFLTGTLGMASQGRDTEGSQWFVTHSPQPHLDGIYTALGYLEEGWDVLSLLQEGDEVLRAALEPGGG